MAWFWTVLVGSLFGFGFSFLAILSYPMFPFVGIVGGVVWLGLGFGALGYARNSLAALFMFSAAAGAFFSAFMPIG